MDYQKVYLKRVREREVTSLFGFIIVDGVFISTGKWFTDVTIVEQKYKIRYKQFDSVYWHWGDWEFGWEFIEIDGF